MFFNPIGHDALHKYRNRVCPVDEVKAFKLNYLMLETEQVKQLISREYVLIDKLILER